VVASGTSAETATNNENTSWTPGSLIGSDTTYYWCAQNNDGGSQSSWVSMGNFVLDATAPTVPGIPQATVGTNLTSQNWSWAASTDAGSGMKQYDWRITSVPSGTTYSGTTTISNLLTNLVAGNWKFYVKAEDNAGNQSTESSSVLAVLSPSADLVIVDCSDPLVYIVTPSDVSDPSLDLSLVTTPDGELLAANLSCDILLKSLLPSATVIVNIPTGAVIKGPSSTWTKIIVPPIITSTTVPAPSGFSSQVVLATLIGHNIAPLEVTKGVRIFIEGQGGKKVGYISNNVFTEITSICSADSQTIGDALTIGGDCKIEDGSDLIIWTKHFSKFVTYTVSQNPSSGGSSMPVEWYSSPEPPVGGFSVSINPSASSGPEKIINSSAVTLNLRGGSDTVKMVISNSPDFKDAGQENYVATKAWNLCWKNAILQTFLDCPAGTYTVYAKYYTSWGTVSNVVSDTIMVSGIIIASDPIVLKKLDQVGQGLSLIQPFTKDLKLGQALADVKQLQIFLNQYFDTQIAKSGAGSPGKETTFFGSLTRLAVIKFQEKYASEILTPLGLKKGTGVCAEYTREKINKLLGF
jgi:hypothetical protein